MKTLSKNLKNQKITPRSTNIQNAIDNQYIAESTAQNTRDAYQSDIRQFELWGGSLPCRPSDLANYLVHEARTKNPRTLARRVTAIKHWHVLQGFDDPTLDPLVKKTMKGITNVHQKPKEKARALDIDVLRELSVHLKQEATYINFRDAALLCLGFFAALRRSELVAVRYEDLIFLDEGIEILITRSKTDQEGEGQVVAIPYGREDFCAIKILIEWLELAQIKSGPIFVKINKWGHVGNKSITPLAVNQIIKKRVAEIGLNPNEYSSHSLRRGLATTASKNGASMPAIMRQGRWKHVKTVMEYIEESERFSDNVLDSIL